MRLRTSYQKEIDTLCKLMSGGDYNIRQVTKGALTQARAKLNPWAFRRLTEIAVDTFYSEAPYKIWKEHRLLAVDGSTLRLPKSDDIIKEFGSHKFGPKADAEGCMARCSLLHDILNNVTLDSRIGKFTQSERSLLEEHRSMLKEGDILIGDRGYPSYKLMYSLINDKVDFLFRMKEGWWLEVREFAQSSNKQAIVELDLTKVSPEKKDVFDQKETLKVRLIKIELEDGKIEILCTSLLNKKKYLHRDFKELYHLRWQVEETYKLLKSRLEIEAFSGRTANSIYQDFYAKIFMMTLCATLSYPIDEKVRQEYKKEKTGNKNDQQINRTFALSTTRDNLINLFIKQIRQLTIDAMDSLIEKTREIVRPYRKNPRPKYPKKKYSTNYKFLA